MATAVLDPASEPAASQLPGLSVGSPLSPDEPLWRWASEAIGTRVGTMLDHLDEVRKGEDIEAVHDMRVASRRLVAAMRVFRTCFRDPRYEKLLREARQVTRALGAVRDLDVLIDHYERLQGEATEEDPGVRYFLAVHDRRRRRARRPMLRALKKLERTGFPRRVQKYLEQAAEVFGAEGSVRERGSGEGEAPFRAAAPVFLAERHREFYRCARYADEPEAVAELHEMRIAAKWLRYTMELFAPAYGDELKQPLDAVKKCQELLGDIHDSDVRIEILTGMTISRLKVRGLEAIGQLDPAPVARALGRVLERERAGRDRQYRKFLSHWRTLEKRGFAESLVRRLGQPDAAPEGSHP